MKFKYLVIGCGIMGSAAAMHLAASSDGVALLGPDEDMADRDANIPKASHHDVGRITRGGWTRILSGAALPGNPLSVTASSSAKPVLSFSTNAAFCGWIPIRSGWKN